MSAKLVKPTLLGLGALSALQIALKTAAFLRLNVLATPDMYKYKNPSTNPSPTKGSNSWAIVTGASEGIGRAFVEALATHGFNVVMISLDDAILEKSHRELAERFSKSNIRIEKIGFDFSQPFRVFQEILFPKLNRIIRGGGDKWGSVTDSSFFSVLVNNVGINYPFPRPYDTISSERESLILRVNCESALHMTKYVLPNMKKFNAGAIINMSSVTGTIPAGLLSTYAATKVFNAHFSKSLGNELRDHKSQAAVISKIKEKGEVKGKGKVDAAPQAVAQGKGIDCLAVAPNFIATRMSRRSAGGIVNTPEELANAALGQLGKTDFTAGGFRQNMIMGFYHSLPAPILNAVVLGANTGVMNQGFVKEEARKRKKQQSKL